MPELPCSPSAPGAAGHGIVVLKPYLEDQVGSVFERYDEKRKVSPLLSERCSVTTGMLGSVTPRLRLAICVAFHFVIWPWYIPESTLPESLRCESTPGTL